ncbi:MAG: prepilin-type N-terminal cleavage/methylation domain-containing protein [Candidatus Abawacabacteria bacterium]|nr:prepilin-type N-terminal cleavage/methylation domain-containing protein [Candidatus Abawacabacteria bacterium]
MKKKSGFTIVELLLSVAVIMIFAGVTLPLYYRLQIQSDLDTTVHTLVRSIRRAQILAQAVKEDSKWGIRMNVGEITIFKGNSYAGRDSDFDEVFAIPTTVAFSGLQEVTFAKFTGKPQQTGTITCSTSNANKSITLNAKGILSY